MITVTKQKKLTPIEFKLCFTVAERIAIKALKDSNVIIADFLEVLDDPRLTEVNLSLQSNKDAIDYLISLSVVSAERKDEILSGIMK